MLEMTTALEILKRDITSQHKIEFPVYKLSGEPLLYDNLLYLEGSIIDDLTVRELTLGHRRLLSKNKLKLLKKPLFDIVELIKYQEGSEGWYIDKFGKVFTYNKTIFSKLVCHRIKQIVSKETYTLLSLEGINFYVPVKRPPSGSFGHMLYYGDFPWKLYNVLYYKIRDTSKKV
jgi:hypothetical protein